LDEVAARRSEGAELGGARLATASCLEAWSEAEKATSLPGEVSESEKVASLRSTRREGEGVSPESSSSPSWLVSEMGPGYVEARGSSRWDAESADRAPLAPGSEDARSGRPMAPATAPMAAAALRKKKEGRYSTAALLLFASEGLSSKGRRTHATGSERSSVSRTDDEWPTIK
jgi:hypothetical protein